MAAKKTTKNIEAEVCIPEVSNAEVQEFVETQPTVNEAFKKLLEVYKLQNPAKYELKKAELEAKLLNNK